MASVSDVIVEVSRDLNDQEPGYEYERWTQQMLISYLNDALRQIAIRRPDEMVGEVVLPLVTGDRQTLPSQYRSLISILSAQDDSCGPGARMTAGDWDSWAASNLPTNCTPAPVDGVYRGRDYFYNPNHPRFFGLFPPVPAGISASVNASVVLNPQTFTIGQLGSQITGPGDKHLSAVIAWMKHRAYSVDSESILSQQKASSYLAEFREALGISQAADSRHQSGWNQGQRGSGDPQAARR